jgi:hypothetical protein
MADNAASYSSYGTNATSMEDLAKQLGDLTKYVRGEDARTGGRVPRDPVDIARGEISNIYKTEKATRKELPSIFESYMNRIARGSMDPDEARYAYLDIARASRGNLSDAYKKADLLGSQTPGIVSSERYDRYKPAYSLAVNQLLGRTPGEQEFKNLVSAAQGLGISKGPDFQAFVGETLLSSPEYKSKAVIFDPAKVAGGIQSAAQPLRTAASLKDYSAMLNAY